MGNIVMSEHPTIISLRVGRPREVGADDPAGKPWTTASFKHAFEGPVWLGETNLAGDEQADLRVHGGPDKAVCAYPATHYPYWRRELGLSDDEFAYGAFGENWTLSSVAEPEVCIGDVLTVGGARVQVSQPRGPCWKLARRWGVKDLAVRVQERGYTGWYFRVLDEGEVAAGMPLVLVDRPYPQWTVARANEVMYHVRDDLKAAAALAACPALATSWKLSLGKRLLLGAPADQRARTHGEA
jgi:MOSC domain-containing protein YiiM